MAGTQTIPNQTVQAEQSSRAVKSQNEDLILKAELNAIYTIVQSRVQTESLSEVIRALGKMALTDETTSLPNRCFFQFFLERSIKNAHATSSSLILLLVDLDNFSDLESEHGHMVTEKFLSQFSLIFGQQAVSLQALLQKKELYAKIGRDRFAVVLPNASMPLASRVAEKIRQSLKNTPIQDKGGIIKTSVTATISITSLTPQDNNLEKFITRAEQSLHIGKISGKNRVVTDKGGDQ